MNLRQWLLARPDGRRRVDVLHLVFCSTAQEILAFTLGRTPLDIVESGQARPGEYSRLVSWLRDCCPGFWAKLDPADPRFERRVPEPAEHTLLSAARTAIAKTNWVALPPDQALPGKPWGEADDAAVQDFIGAFEDVIALAIQGQPQAN